jgi:polar amino acid transport system substrate-binding protein
MKKRIFLFLTIALVAAISFTGCGSSDKGSEKKTYKIGTDLTFAPFEFEKDGEFIGIDVDILAAIAKAEGFEYELLPMNFNGIIPGLASNQLDGAIAGMTITEERAKVLDFSNGYYESGIIAVVNANNDEINSVADFKNKKFAVKKGTTGATYAEEHKDEFNASIRYFDDSPSTFQEVTNGNSDITFGDYPVIAYKISLDTEPTLKLVGDKLSSANFGFAVKKGQNKELLEMFNSGLKKIKESGEYEQILNKYR